MVFRSIVRSWRLLTIKVPLYILCLAVFIASGYTLVSLSELRLISEFQALTQVNPLPKARELAEAGEYCEALEYLDYFREYEYARTNPEVTKLYNEIKAERESLEFRAQDVWSGIWEGKGACAESLVSATVSDFLVIGDLRDLIRGAVGKYYGAESDDFTMALAGVGVLLTGVTVGATISSGGAAAPAAVPTRVSLSMIKLAKKMGKLPAALQKSLTRLMRKAKATGSLKPLKPVTSSVYSIATVPGLKVRDFLTIISRAEKVEDLKLLEKAATTYGKQTGKFLKLAGSAPLEVLRRFGKSRNLDEAVNTSIKYGPRGSRLLAKTGPDKFLKYVTIAKFTTRATRSVWKNRLNVLLAGILKRLPLPVLYGLFAGSGLVVVAAPGFAVRRFIRRRRSVRAALRAEDREEKSTEDQASEPV